MIPTFQEGHWEIAAKVFAKNLKLIPMKAKITS
jgi:hypothetical protein